MYLFYWLRETWRQVRGQHNAMTARNTPCSFCRKSYREVDQLVEGHGHVYICHDCIDLCRAIVYRRDHFVMGMASSEYDRIVLGSRLVSAGVLARPGGKRLARLD